MSLEPKVVLLTVALVAYLVLFNLSPCWQWDCCGQGLGNLTEPNGTTRWGPAHPRPHGGLFTWCLLTPRGFCVHREWAPCRVGLADGLAFISQLGLTVAQVPGLQRSEPRNSIHRQVL